MQNIDLICIGKMNASYFASGVAEYQKRLGGFCNFRIIELPEASIADKNASDRQIAKALQKESDAILASVRKGAYLVALCVEGKQISSEDLAALLAERAGSGAGDIAFVIGSSHVVHGIDPYYPKYYEGRSEKPAYREYFESILENLNTYSDFDVYGHLDYVVRYGPDRNRFYTYEAYADIIDEILRKLISMGKGIEVNTAGFKYGLGHPNPTEAVLLRYHELGGEILTLGADAHAPEHVAYAFDRLPQILRHAGFRYFTVFTGRKPDFLPLPE